MTAGLQLGVLLCGDCGTLASTIDDRLKAIGVDLRVTVQFRFELSVFWLWLREHGDVSSLSLSLTHTQAQGIVEGKDLAGK